jgi:UDPglucose--hexose-1-phosphate uridylyltransferase
MRNPASAGSLSNYIFRTATRAVPTKKIENMSELRQNRATKEWIILATERSKRPDEFKLEKEKRKKQPPFDSHCPFCPGNEDQTPNEIFSKKEKGKWKVRVIPNKFPALLYKEKFLRETEGFFINMDGVGRHEVLIETPQHNRSLATLALKDLEQVCLTYRERYLELKKSDKRIKTIIIFRNHGLSAGTSLVHPHSQIIALPLVPTQIRHLLEEAMRYFDDHGSCVFCDMIREEISFKKRVIYQDKDFLAFHPFAPRVPFETWILPFSHNAAFGNISSRKAKKIARPLKIVLGELYKKLDDPDYNLIFRTAPLKDAEEDYYHWYIQILPRLTTPAGFELGSGVYITTQKPEDTARFIQR